jgi:tetratricopeptide (TPR) repeat protein
MLFSLVVTLALSSTPQLDSPVTTQAEALAKQVLTNAGDPRAAAPLMRLHGLMDDLDDLNLLADPYASLLYRRNTEPHVRVLARLFMADVERARGRTVKAQEVLAPLGFVKDWWVVGSFENEGKTGCDTDFGPESAVDLHASYPAATREVSWRKPNAAATDGYIDLTLSLQPSTDAVGYALTFLTADTEMKTELSLGTPGGYRLFVNGVKVASSDRYNRPRPDQHRVQVTLRKGTNRVLLKLCQVSGPYGFYFRAEKAEGAKGTLGVTLPEVVPPLEKGPGPQPVALPTLADVLEKKVKASEKDAALRMDYATVLAWTRAWPEVEHTPDVEGERAALQKPDDAELQLTAGLLHTDDFNDRRRFLETAVKLAPANPFARVALARLELDREHPAVALAHADALLKAFPLFAPAHVVRIRALDALGDKVGAQRATEDAFAKLKAIPSIAREAAGLSRRRDRLEEAIERNRMVLALRFDDTGTRRALASLLADVGRVDEAAEQYRKVLALDPFDSGSILRLAELLSANGKVDEARSLFQQAKGLAPEEPDVYEREGRALLHAGQKDAALEAFQRSLVLKPQNPALKEMVRTLRGDDDGPSEEAYAVPELAKALGKDVVGEDAVVLAEVTHVKVQPSGVAARFYQLAVKVQTQRGVESFRQMPLTWSPDRQEVRVLKTRITKPDGSVVDSFSEQDRNINEPWTGMYYDTRARVLTFPALAPGDVLEIQWRLEDVAVDNLLSDYWGDVDMVRGMHPKLRYRYVVEMPKTRPLYWNKSALPAWLKTAQADKGEKTVYRFEASQVPRVVPEPNMPGWAEVASPLHLSTYKTWEDVGHYYWGLVRDQLVPNEEMKRTVDEALKGVNRADTEAVVAALYGFVVTNTRYVALEFGIHGYKPYRVDRVLARRFGDCKDKASLIHAMLGVAGVDSRLVLLRMRNLGSLTGEVASLSAFNHAIVYVPKLDRFLDGTAEFHGSHELASADRLANVLIVEPQAPSRFLTTPEANPEDNVSSLELAVALKVDGSAQVKGKLRTSGQGAPEQRRAYETPATRTSVFEQQWAQSFPGAQVGTLTVSDVKALEQPVSIDFTASLPRLAEAGGGILRFYPFGASRTFTQALAPLSERTYDVVLPGVWVNHLVFTYQLPAGWTLPEVPPDVVEESPFGSVRIVTKRVDGGLRVDGVMVVKVPRIAAKDYPAFRAWLMTVDQAFSRKLVVQQGGQSARR